MGDGHVARGEQASLNVATAAAAAAGSSGKWVVDFGQNIAGTVQLTIPAAVLACVCNIIFGLFSSAAPPFQQRLEQTSTATFFYTASDEKRMAIAYFWQSHVLASDGQMYMCILSCASTAAAVIWRGKVQLALWYHCRHTDNPFGAPLMRRGCTA
jgi:phosphotransferase system  glucose/maltose/N-acetylglucosamine-specific IIC component